MPRRSASARRALGRLGAARAVEALAFLAQDGAYRKLADLQEYSLVDVDRRRLELYRREAEHWILLESEGDGPALPLQSVGMSLSPAQAFEDLDEEA